jgi:hypothetical protein
MKSIFKKKPIWKITVFLLVFIFGFTSLTSTGCKITLDGEKRKILWAITAARQGGNSATGIVDLGTELTTGTSTVATPKFSPAAGYYTSPQNISMSSTTIGASIYYSTDGKTPTTSSAIFNTAIHIWSLAGRTMKAYATKAGFTDSAILSGVFSYPPLKSGQMTSYNVGDDGNAQLGVARNFTGPTAHPLFTSDYTTTDNATGLVWKTCSQGLSGATCASDTAVTLTWDNASADATNGCTALNSTNSGNGYAGIKNWRVPTRIELSTLTDSGKTTSPTINVTAFPATVVGGYWSSAYAQFTTYAWYVNFLDGSVNTGNKTSAYYVRCVFGQPKGSSLSFTDNSDGTVKDNATSLIWQKCSGGLNNDSACSGTATTYTWGNAITYCNSLLLASKTWRLPNRNELESIVDISKTAAPTIDSTAFPGTIFPTSYWSSTTCANNTANAWSISFCCGNVDTNGSKVSMYNVRCVSGP